MYQQVVKEKTINIAELQDNLDDIIREVSENDVAVIVERTNGAPVVIISIAEYRRLRELKERQ